MSVDKGFLPNIEASLIYGEPIHISDTQYEVGLQWLLDLDDIDGLLEFMCMKVTSDSFDVLRGSI